LLLLLNAMCVVGKQETSNNNILDWSDVIEHTTNCAHIRRHSADFIRSSRLTTRRAAGYCGQNQCVTKIKKTFVHMKL
jgi:hypothetical protein